MKRVKLNPWLQERLRGVDPPNLRVIVEVDEKHFTDVLNALRGMGVRIVDTSFNRFITIVVPDAPMLEAIERLPGVVEIHYDAPVWIKPVDFNPVSFILSKIDPLLGRIAVSQVEIPSFKPPYPPVPFGAQFMPRVKRQDVEIIPNTITKRIIVDIETVLSGRGVRAAAIDTGATPTHPQFVGKELRTYTTMPEVPYDLQGHGQWVTTQVAGAPYDTRFGRVEGIAPAADAVHIKALSTLGFGSTSSVLKAMEMMLATGAKVVNMSLGGPQQGPVDHDPLCKAARILAQHGVIVVAAAGNEGPGSWTIASPGVCPDVLTVGAWSPMYEDVAVYSSRGPSGEWYRDHKSDWEEDLKKYGDRLVKPDVIAPGGGPAKAGQKPVDLIYSGVTGWFDGFYDLLADGFEPMRGTCLPRDTIIYTPDGPVELGELKPGDYIYSFDGTQIVPVKLQAVIDQGVKEVYEVELADGRTLIATGNHPVLIYNRWNNRETKPFKYKRVDELTPNDHVVLAAGVGDGIPENVVPELREVITEDIARALGYFLADGWITRSRRNNMICTAHDGEWFFRTLGIPCKPYEKGRWLYTYSKRLALALSLLGLDQKHRKAKLPKWVFHLPRNHMTAFLRGFCFGDGTRKVGSFAKEVSADAYRIELASEELVKDLRILCDYADVFTGKLKHRERYGKAPNSKEPRLWRTWQLYMRFDKRPSLITRVVRVTPIGKERVYDLSVPPYQNFIANGIIVHNSMATPHATGLLTLVAEAVPEITVDMVKKVVGSLAKEKSPVYGWGMIRLSLFARQRES